MFERRIPTEPPTPGRWVDTQQSAFNAELREGTSDVFLELTENYKTPIFQFFYRLLSDHIAAEGSTEQVFIRAFKARRLISARTDVKSWFFRIACDLARTRKLETFIRNGDAGASTPIERAVRTLPFKEILVILLHRFARLSFAQIGTVLRTTEGAARTHVQDSYLALHRQLAVMGSA